MGLLLWQNWLVFAKAGLRRPQVLLLNWVELGWGAWLPPQVLWLTGSPSVEVGWGPWLLLWLTGRHEFNSWSARFLPMSACQPNRIQDWIETCVRQHLHFISHDECWTRWFYEHNEWWACWILMVNEWVNDEKNSLFLSSTLSKKVKSETSLWIFLNTSLV